MASTPPDFTTQTPAQALANLNAAIYAIEVKGQAYQIGDRKLTRGDLRWLYPERARLEKLVASKNRGGMRMRRVVPL